jgi:hypothetical protein
MEQLVITPKTKISDLLDAYPHLEDLLIEMAPPFKKLKNPLLRKTIARITTISQAATIGSLNVEELVNKLRSEVGQDHADIETDSGTTFNTQKPDWFDAAKVVDEILKVIAPFLPAPLIEKATSLGAGHWVNQLGDELFEIYFSAPVQ